MLHPTKRPTPRGSYTYALLEVSASAYTEIRAALADYPVFDTYDGRELIDMHGVALMATAEPVSRARMAQPDEHAGVE